MKLYRSEIFSQIESQIKDNNLAQSMLFSGPSGSGRASLAFDMAKEMGINDIIVFFSRQLNVDLDASYNLLKTKYSKRFINFFASSVRRIIMQYHPSLQKEGIDGQKDKLFNLASDIATALDDMLKIDAEDKKKVLEAADEIYKNASKGDLSTRGRKKSQIAVDEVRSVQNYLLRLSSPCLVIIENIEDSPEASRNALLKILEEPYKDVYFVLISEQKERILSTILSRVRKYDFSPLNKIELDYYLKNEFLAEKSYDSYKDFIFEMSTSDQVREEIMMSSKKISSAFISSSMLSVEELDECYKALDKNSTYFFSLLVKETEKAFVSGEISVKKARLILNSLNKAKLENAVYNQNIKSALDAALREVCLVC